MVKTHVCMMTYPNQACAQGARKHLEMAGLFWVATDAVDGGEYVSMFIVGSPQLTIAQQRILDTFHATDIELTPANARQGYENYCHVLYYNEHEALDEAVGYLIDIDRRAMAYDCHEDSAYSWKVVFCTESEIPQEQKDRITAAVVPVAWVWNDPITGDVSPTNIFK